MPTAEDIFTGTFMRFMKNWTFITSLRQVADVALPIAEESLGAIHTDFVERASVDPNYKNIFVSLDGSETGWGDNLKDLLRKGMTESAITNAKAAIDAASLVFAQSILDDCALSYLRVCALANPTHWDPIIKEKKVAFSSVVKPPEEIRMELIEDKLDLLEWESLLKKVDLLFQLCSPPENFAPINNYKYDRNRLEQIDDRRHGIIHRNAMTEPLANIDEDLDFISKTANFLMGLVNQKYDIRLNPAMMFNLPDPRAEKA
jgi:hypothetical protein